MKKKAEQAIINSGDQGGPFCFTKTGKRQGYTILLYGIHANVAPAIFPYKKRIAVGAAISCP